MIQNNMLSPLGFNLKINITPNVNYLVQQVILPGINIGSADVATQLGLRLANPGNITYQDLTINFKVGEDLSDYLEIYNWMIAIGHPDKLSQYIDKKSDASLVILNSARNPIISVRFTDMYPTSLSPIHFDATMADVQYVTAEATFRFNRFYYDTI